MESDGHLKASINELSFIRIVFHLKKNTECIQCLHQHQHFYPFKAFQNNLITNFKYSCNITLICWTKYLLLYQLCTFPEIILLYKSFMKRFNGFVCKEKCVLIKFYTNSFHIYVDFYMNSIFFLLSYLIIFIK